MPRLQHRWRRGTMKSAVSKRKALGSTPCSDAAVTKAFMAWLEKEGVKLHKCALHCFDGSRGVIATKTIEQDEVVVEVSHLTVQR